MGYFDTLTIPIIENTAHEEDLKESLEKAMDKYPDTCAVLVRRHGVYVWGDTVWKAKTQCERYVYFLRVHRNYANAGFGIVWIISSSLQSR